MSENAKTDIVLSQTQKDQVEQILLKLLLPGGTVFVILSALVSFIVFYAVPFAWKVGIDGAATSANRAAASANRESEKLKSITENVWPLAIRCDISKPYQGAQGIFHLLILPPTGDSDKEKFVKYRRNAGSSKEFDDVVFNATSKVIIEHDGDKQATTGSCAIDKDLKFLNSEGRTYYSVQGNWGDAKN